MNIEIGDKPLKEMTAENIMELVMIIGAHNSPECWNGPFVLDFDNELFSDTIVVKYACRRKSDNKTIEYSFFFNFEKFSWHYTKDFEIHHKQHRHHANKLGLPELRYLISQGFDVPLYENKTVGA